MSTDVPHPISRGERATVVLLAAIQFTNILDFMIVAPLGPDFATALAIPESKLGVVTGSYTAAACVSGLLGSLVLDRFGRRGALALALFGLTLGTAAGGLATGFGTLVFARVLAGFFGGPATSLAYAILADVVPEARRGRAISVLMTAFSAASVLGVPAALKLAEWGSWRTPFFGVAAVGLVAMVACLALLPPLRGHLAVAASGRPRASFGDLARDRSIVLAYVLNATAMLAGFAVIPNFSAFVQNNLGYPREDLSFLYGCGGVASFVAMAFLGRLVDRVGATPVGAAGTALLVAVVWSTCVAPEPVVPVVAFFVGFMLAMTIRNVAMSTLTTKVPAPEIRARFQSILSAVQHFASAAGALLGPPLLTTLPGGKLEGMWKLGLVSIVAALVLPFAMWAVERRVRARAAVPAAAAA